MTEEIKEEIELQLPKAVEEIEEKDKKKEFDTTKWEPKTELGRKVKAGEIKNIDEILDSGLAIKEVEIIDVLISNIATELLLVGQAKGKFGGGQRRVFRQTQKKTAEGNKPHFATVAAVGNYDGYIGIGLGKGKETVPAREKAYRNAKLNIIKIRRGCGSWQCNCKTPHSIPFKVKGKAGSVEIELMPAPKGTGLCVEDEVKKILSLAGIKDVWSRSDGTTTTKLNMVLACFDALKHLMKTKVKEKYNEQLGICEGALNHEKDSSN